jgi:hypothetical protein
MDAGRSFESVCVIGTDIRRLRSAERRRKRRAIRDRREHSRRSIAHGRRPRTTDGPVIDIGHITADTWPCKFGFDQRPATQTHRPEFVGASSERKISEACREARNCGFDADGGALSKTDPEMAFLGQPPESTWAAPH